MRMQHLPTTNKLQNGERKCMNNTCSQNEDIYYVSQKCLYEQDELFV
jgi:hypothetical protein